MIYNKMPCFFLKTGMLTNQQKYVCKLEIMIFQNRNGEVVWCFVVYFTEVLIFI